MCKPNYCIILTRIYPHCQSYRLYFIVIIKKISIQNGNSTITDPITKMGVIHAFDLFHPKNCNSFIPTLPFLALSSHKVYQSQITPASVVNIEPPLCQWAPAPAIYCAGEKWNTLCQPNVTIVTFNYSISKKENFEENFEENFGSIWVQTPFHLWY